MRAICRHSVFQGSLSPPRHWAIPPPIFVLGMGLYLEPVMDAYIDPSSILTSLYPAMWERESCSPATCTIHVHILCLVKIPCHRSVDHGTHAIPGSPSASA